MQLAPQDYLLKNVRIFRGDILQLKLLCPGDSYSKIEYFNGKKLYDEDSCGRLLSNKN